MTEDRCSDCKFLSQHDRTCRYNAPIARVMPTVNGSRPADDTHWPKVTFSDWCGRFLPRPVDRPEVCGEGARGADIVRKIIESTSKKPTCWECGHTGPMREYGMIYGMKVIACEQCHADIGSYAISMSMANRTPSR